MCQVAQGIFAFDSLLASPIINYPFAEMSDQAPVTPSFRISPARTEFELKVLAELFAAYAKSLPVDLGYQGFASELAQLPGKYLPPLGELLIAWDGLERPVGCVGLRPLGVDCCEMKRLYVVPEARSVGVGKLLMDSIVAVARGCGYAKLYLDTLPTMGNAVRLYEQSGFRETDAYYGPTPRGTRFMVLNLVQVEERE